MSRILLEEYIKRTIKVEWQGNLSESKIGNSELYNRAINAIYHEELNDAELKVIEDNILQVAERSYKNGIWGLLNCNIVCKLWSNIFKKNGIPHRIVGGYYWDSTKEEREYMSPPGSSDHVWIEFPGDRIFDPTAGQFTDEIKKEYYIEENL